MERTTAGKRWIVVGVVAGLGLLLPAVAGAQGADVRTHTFGAFAGGIHIDHETEFTFGALYEYRPIPLLGLGPVAEYTPSAYDGDGSSAFLGALYLHPWRGIRLTAGAGAEVIYEHEVETDFLVRVGAAYEFGLGPVGLMPTLNLDLFDGEEAVVFGLTVVGGP